MSDPAQSADSPDPEIRLSPPDFFKDSQGIAIRFPGEDQWRVLSPSGGRLNVGKQSGMESHIERAWTPFVPIAAAPQVWFPGDTVPAGVSLVTKHGDLLTARATPYRITGGPTAAYVEVTLPSLTEWAAIVDRARAEREES